jgi:L-galactose dehydrogenase/L-glyceraldehyde 3-phosphate reductase
MELITEDHAASLAEAAIRYVIANQAMNTILVGMAAIDQFEQALAAVNKGPLSAAALQRVQTLQQAFVGEPR